MIKKFNTYNKSTISNVMNGIYGTSDISSGNEIILGATYFVSKIGDIKSGQTFTVTSQTPIPVSAVVDIKLYINSGLTLTNATQIGYYTCNGTSSLCGFSRTIRPYGTPNTTLDLLDVTSNSNVDYPSQGFLNSIDLPYNIENTVTYFFMTAQKISGIGNSIEINYLTVEI